MRSAVSIANWLATSPSPCPPTPSASRETAPRPFCEAPSSISEKAMASSLWGRIGPVVESWAQLIFTGDLRSGDHGRQDLKRAVPCKIRAGQDGAKTLARQAVGSAWGQFGEPRSPVQTILSVLAVGHGFHREPAPKWAIAMATF